MKIRGSYPKFPQHFRDIIKGSGLNLHDIAKMLNISYNRWQCIYYDAYNARPDNTEFRAIKRLVQSIEQTQKMGKAVYE